MVRMKPDQVEINFIGDLRLNAEVPQIFEVPGGLYPLRTKAFEIDEYRIMAGWPRAIPPYDIFARSMISATGARFSDRSAPTEVSTNATVRWIADEQYYDLTSLRWNPHYDRTPGAYWRGTSASMPTFVDDYSYRIGSEVFVHKALNFDSDARKHMWGDFTNSIGGSAGYTVLMVLSPTSIYGNSPDTTFQGLWGPGMATPSGETFTEPLPDHWVAVTMTNNDLFYSDEAKERVYALAATSSVISSPLYIAMVFARPEVLIYVGSGPSSLRVKALPSGTQTAVPLGGQIALGRTPGDVLHTADMALFDLSIYGFLLNPAEVQTEVSQLAQAYGGGPL